ncbi:MAG TPA: alpha-2-macroglobulin family protein, partial [Nordella sp.]|nr:alpha-2-macroglobulin family protein [Nordella sp.]
RPRANAAFQSAAAALKAEADGTSTVAWGYYGSPLRNAAAIVALAENGNASPPVIQAALNVITEQRAKYRYASTQEMTWMVLAARNVVDQARSIELNVDGSVHQGAFYKVYRGANLDEAHKVSNLGTTPLQAVVAVAGAPAVAEPASSNGMTLMRIYYTLDGTPVDPVQVEQNTRLVVVVSASRDGNDQSGNFLLVDRLPAGLEIENPTLVATGNTGSLSWLTDLTDATYTEFRDDRFVAAFRDQSAKLAYIVRAVAPGRYTLPGATVEDMYRPDRNATLATTVMSVIER